MKYVLFEKKTPAGTVINPIIFPNHINHCDIVSELQDSLGVPISAGDIAFSLEYIGGGSASTGLENHKDDAGKIRTIDYFFIR